MLFRSPCPSFLVSYTCTGTHLRGDHTFADSYLTVLPNGTEFVVFSIDGSFAAWGAVALPGLHGPSSSVLTPSHFPVFPLPDPKIGPHRATVCLAVPRVFVVHFSSPWGLPSPTPGPSEPSSSPTCPTLARSPGSRRSCAWHLLGTRALFLFL